MGRRFWEKNNETKIARGNVTEPKEVLHAHFLFHHFCPIPISHHATFSLEYVFLYMLQLSSNASVQEGYNKQFRVSLMSQNRVVVENKTIFQIRTQSHVHVFLRLVLLDHA